jgi:hypothetical protein
MNVLGGVDASVKDEAELEPGQYAAAVEEPYEDLNSPPAGYRWTAPPGSP